MIQLIASNGQRQPPTAPDKIYPWTEGELQHYTTKLRKLHQLSPREAVRVGRAIDDLIQFHVTAAKPDNGAAMKSEQPAPPAPEKRSASVDVKEAARLLGVADKTVRREINRGRLPAFFVGRLLRIARPEIARYREERRVRQ